MEIASRGVGNGVCRMEMMVGIALACFPAPSIVQLHPVILSVLNFASVLQSLREQITEVIIIGGIFEPKVANVRQVLVELL